MSASVELALNCSGLRRSVANLLDGDPSILASLARARLSDAMSLSVVVGRSGQLPDSVDASQSLLQMGRDWQVDAAEARALVATVVVGQFTAGSSLRVSAFQPGVRATDPFVESEPLYVMNGSGVWASATEVSNLELVERVLGLSEGYPPGVVVVHEGPPWAPTSGSWFAVSAFDGETFVWWQ